MTKTEFLNCLSSELKKRNIADFADILEEYEQHFIFKLSDGYSEEEVAKKLGDPKILAAQFEPCDGEKNKNNKNLNLLWLLWVDLFFGLFFILLIAFGLVLVSSAISFFAVGLALLFNMGSLPFVTLPSMPYWCGAILGLSLVSLGVLSVTGSVWFFAFIRQIFRSYKRFHQNILGAALPGITVTPQFSAKQKRNLRNTALISLALFAVCFVLSYIVCSLSAGNLQFWHTWGWFK